MVERIICPWAGILLPPRTMEGLVRFWGSDGSGRLDAADVNSSISLFASLDHLEQHMSGGKAELATGIVPGIVHSWAKLEPMEVGPDGKIDQNDFAQLLQEFAECPAKVQLAHVIHVFQELEEIKWVFVMWAGSKSASLTIPELQSVLKPFNKWAMTRYEASSMGLMCINPYDPTVYDSSIDLRAFTRWIWEELSIIEEQFGEPFEVMLGKLSECVQDARDGGNRTDEKKVEKCPWSGSLLPPRTMKALLCHFESDASGCYAAEDINKSMSIFNSLDSARHLVRGNENFPAALLPKMQLFTPGGKVKQEDIEAVMKDFCKSMPGEVSLVHVIHIFQEIQEIEWVFANMAGDLSAVLPSEAVSCALRNFNTWSKGRHGASPNGRMMMNHFDKRLYGENINLGAFTKWLWEELSVLEELFSEPFEMTLQYFDQCAQVARVTDCFRIWDATGGKTIDSKAMVRILSELLGDEVDNADVQALLALAGLRSDGKLEYAKFLEAIMLPTTVLK